MGQDPRVASGCNARKKRVAERAVFDIQSERATEFLTQQCARSTSGAAGYAGRQAGAVRTLG